MPRFCSILILWQMNIGANKIQFCNEIINVQIIFGINVSIRFFCSLLSDIIIQRLRKPFNSLVSMHMNRTFSSIKHYAKKTSSCSSAVLVAYFNPVENLLLISIKQFSLEKNIHTFLVSPCLVITIHNYIFVLRQFMVLNLSNKNKVLKTLKYFFC